MARRIRIAESHFGSLEDIPKKKTKSENQKGESVSRAKDYEAGFLCMPFSSSLRVGFCRTVAVLYVCVVMLELTTLLLVVISYVDGLCLLRREPVVTSIRVTLMRTRTLRSFNPFLVGKVRISVGFFPFVRSELRSDDGGTTTTTSNHSAVGRSDGLSKIHQQLGIVNPFLEILVKAGLFFSTPWSVQ